MLKKLYNFGDKFEDKVRGHLSHYPIVYAFIGGAGIIIFWRGVWHTMDYLMELFFVVGDSVTSASGMPELPWWDGPLSIIIGTVMLLVTGLFVYSFIGNEIIISGLKREKKIAEKTEEEIAREAQEHGRTEMEIHEIDEKLKEIEEILKR